MVGSELPTPETRERTVTDVAVLELDDAHRRRPRSRSAQRRRRRERSRCTAARSSASPASRATARANSSSAIIGLDAIDRARSASTASTSPGCRPSERRDSGIGYIAEDRQKDGLVLPFTVWENAALGHQHRPPYGQGSVDRTWPAPRRRPSRSSTSSTCAPRASTCPTFTLSGGNQQKLVVGREMTAEPKVLIASHPTRGVDVGAQAVIWDILRDARAAGLGTALDLGRSRRTDRAVRPPARHAARAGGRRARPGDGDAGRTRFVHDRRRKRGHTDVRTDLAGLARPAGRGRRRRSSSRRSRC